jgi:hypothetical protein
LVVHLERDAKKSFARAGTGAGRLRIRDESADLLRPTQPVFFAPGGAFRGAWHSGLDMSRSCRSEGATRKCCFDGAEVRDYRKRLLDEL